MKKYGVILKTNDNRIQVLQTCYSREAVAIAVQLQRNIHSRSEGLVSGILGEFDSNDEIIDDSFRYLCA
ncbi:MAG: hypothetical protein K6C08_15080 [Oscillospiraceae bacterium]|nr:hypothetical protein [Oscillospiraceae bacterium]